MESALGGRARGASADPAPNVNPSQKEKNQRQQPKVKNHPLAIIRSAQMCSSPTYRKHPSPPCSPLLPWLLSSACPPSALSLCELSPRSSLRSLLPLICTPGHLLPVCSLLPVAVDLWTLRPSSFAHPSLPVLCLCSVVLATFFLCCSLFLWGCLCLVSCVGSWGSVVACVPGSVSCLCPSSCCSFVRGFLEVTVVAVFAPWVGGGTSATWVASTSGVVS